MPSKSQSTFSRSRACLAIQNLSATTAIALPLTSGYSNTSRTPGTARASLSSKLRTLPLNTGGRATSATNIPGRSRSMANLCDPSDFARPSSRRTGFKDLAHWEFAQDRMVLAVPKGHALTKRKTVRLRDLRNIPFVWFPRWVNPAFYDRMMQACARGGLSAPRIVQEASDRDTNFGLFQCRIGLSWQPETMRWHYSRGIVLLPIIYMDVRVPFNLIWKKD